MRGRQEALTNIVAFHGQNCVQCADHHPAPEPRNVQERIEGCGQVIVSEELSEAPLSVCRQATPPSPFTVQTPLEMVLTNLAVDLAIAWLFFVGIFLGQICFQAGGEV